MVRISPSLVLASLGAGLIACSVSVGPGSEAWAPDSSSILVESSYTGITDARLSVISDSAAWQAAWSEMFGTLAPQPPAPVVDFAAQSVLLVALGSRPTGGYSIRIDSVAHSATQNVVFVTDTSPGSGCLVTQAITTPVEAVVTPWPVDAAQWYTSRVTHDCT